MVPDWLQSVFVAGWREITGGAAFVGMVVAMLTRPRLGLALNRTDPSECAMVRGTDVALASIVRVVVWNAGLTTAENVTVKVDDVRQFGRSLSKGRAPLKWTGTDRNDGVARFEHRLLLHGKRNALSVDVCVTDSVDSRLHVWSLASDDGVQGYYDTDGIYEIDVIAEASNLWATKAKLTLRVEYQGSGGLMYLKTLDARRHWLTGVL